MTAQHFSEMIETFQTTKGMSIKLIADILGVSPSTIHRWKEQGVPTTKAVKMQFGNLLSMYVAKVN